MLRVDCPKVQIMEFPLKNRAFIRMLKVCEFWDIAVNDRLLYKYRCAFIRA